MLPLGVGDTGLIPGWGIRYHKPLGVAKNKNKITTATIKSRIFCYDSKAHSWRSINATDELLCPVLAERAGPAASVHCCNAGRMNELTGSACPALAGAQPGRVPGHAQPLPACPPWPQLSRAADLQRPGGSWEGVPSSKFLEG